MTKKITTLDDLVPDARNANKHSQRGMAMMEKSLRECGYGDSLTVDRNGNVISGNGRTEAFHDLQMLDPIVVQSDGTRPIIHQRIDLDLATDARAKKLAIMQNRVGEANLCWDPDILRELGGEGVDLSGMWTQEELSELLATVPDFEPAGIDEQGRLDEKAKCTCPECGHTFTP